MIARKVGIMKKATLYPTFDTQKTQMTKDNPSTPNTRKKNRDNGGGIETWLPGVRRRHHTSGAEVIALAMKSIDNLPARAGIGGVHISPYKQQI